MKQIENERDTEKKTRKEGHKMKVLQQRIREMKEIQKMKVQKMKEDGK